MLTKKQLIKFLEIETEETEESYSENNLEKLENEEELTCNGFKIKQVDQYGGEGKGDEYWVVFSVEKDGEKEFWEIPGWYASHNGSELDTGGMFKVEQVEKVVKIWKSIK